MDEWVGHVQGLGNASLSCKQTLPYLFYLKFASLTPPRQEQSPLIPIPDVFSTLHRRDCIPKQFQYPPYQQLFNSAFLNNFASRKNPLYISSLKKKVAEIVSP